MYIVTFSIIAIIFWQEIGLLLIKQHELLL